MIVASVSGRLAFDPREVATKSGKPMTTARVACDDDAGETLWLDVVAFGGKAEWLARATKGDRIAAMGKMRLNRWTGSDGEEREGLQLLADSIIVPAPKPQKNKPPTHADKPKSPTPADPFAGDPDPQGGFDDEDIPF